MHQRENSATGERSDSNQKSFSDGWIAMRPKAIGTGSAVSQVTECVCRLLDIIESRDARIKELPEIRVLDRRLSAGQIRLAYFLLNETVKLKLNLDWHIQRVASELQLPLRGDISLNNALRLLTLAKKNLNGQLSRGIQLALVDTLEKYDCGTAGFYRRFLEEVARLSVDNQLSAGDRIYYLSIKHSHPEWMVRRWYQRFGEDITIDILTSNNIRDPIVIRAHLISVHDLERILAKEGVEVCQASYHPSCLIIRRYGGKLNALRSFQSGLYQVQAEMPAFVVDILSPEPGDRILDMCSAPGGKAVYAAAILKTGQIDAVDIDPVRLKDVDGSIGRLRIRERLQVNIATYCEDGRRYWAEPYDKVLLDVPCSGLGVLSRHADARWHRTEEDIRALVEVQRELIENCACLVKPGGKLVYSTCTTEPEENELQVEQFLSRHLGFDIENLHRYGIPRDLLCNDGYYYYPRKYSSESFGKIQSGFAVSLVKRK